MWSSSLKIEVEDEGNHSSRKVSTNQGFPASKPYGVIGTPIGSTKKQTPRTGPMTNLSADAGTFSPQQKPNPMEPYSFESDRNKSSADLSFFSRDANTLLWSEPKDVQGSEDLNHCFDMLSIKKQAALTTPISRPLTGNDMKPPRDDSSLISSLMWKPEAAMTPIAKEPLISALDRPRPTEEISMTESNYYLRGQPFQHYSPSKLSHFAASEVDPTRSISPRTQRCIDIAVEFAKTIPRKAVVVSKSHAKDKVRAKYDEAIDGYMYQVRFKRAHKTFVLSPSAPRNIVPGMFVKVEADRGEDLGIVLAKIPVNEYEEEIPTAGYRGRGFSSGITDHKFILRLATSLEKVQIAEKVEEEERVLETIRQKVVQRKLPMVILDAEFQFDRHKLTYFFEADARIDFRDLVSELFSLYKTRIWMQQVDTTTIPRPEDPEVQLAFASGLLPQTSLLSVLRTFAGALIPQESYNKLPRRTSTYQSTITEPASGQMFFQGNTTRPLHTADEEYTRGYEYQTHQQILDPNWSFLDQFQR